MIQLLSYILICDLSRWFVKKLKVMKNKFRNKCNRINISVLICNIFELVFIILIELQAYINNNEYYFFKRDVCLILPKKV